MSRAGIPLQLFDEIFMILWSGNYGVTLRQKSNNDAPGSDLSNVGATNTIIEILKKMTRVESEAL